MRRLRGKIPLVLAIAIISFQALKAQNTVCDKSTEPGIFDMGKMWTFDYAPADYFRSTYNFTPDEKWFEEARLSALRFGTFCSASFVSADGLVMTNHHCARGSGFKVQKPGENFNENGFYARTTPGFLSRRNWYALTTPAYRHFSHLCRNYFNTRNVMHLTFFA